MKDGANYQAQAVLAYINTEIEDVKISRWENCREQGYVLSLRNRSTSQLNICFFEHRNSDDICAIKWIQNTINAPTIDTAEFGDTYSDKWDLSHSVSYGEAESMAKWIESEFDQHNG